jgi:hypothetical protein
VSLIGALCIFLFMIFLYLFESAPLFEQVHNKAAAQSRLSLKYVFEYGEDNMPDNQHDLDARFCLKSIDSLTGIFGVQVFP